MGNWNILSRSNRFPFISDVLGVIGTALAVFVFLMCSGIPHPAPPSPAPPVKVCDGINCLRWTGVQASFCQQFDPHDPNDAYQTRIAVYSYRLPIHVFYTVTQRNISGIPTSTSSEQSYVLGSSTGILPICHAAKDATGSIVTQFLTLTCVTQDALPNGATSASCRVADQTNQVVEVDTHAVVSMKTHLRDGNKLLAPVAYKSSEALDCTAICNDESKICMRFSSASIQAGLLNLAHSWNPGHTGDEG